MGFNSGFKGLICNLKVKQCRLLQRAIAKHKELSRTFCCDVLSRLETLEDGTLQPKCRLARKPLSVCCDMLTDALLENGASAVRWSWLEAPGAVPHSASFMLGPNSKRSRTVLFWAITERVLVIYYQRFRTTYRLHLQGSRVQQLCAKNWGVLGYYAASSGKFLKTFRDKISTSSLRVNP